MKTLIKISLLVLFLGTTFSAGAAETPAVNEKKIIEAIRSNIHFPEFDLQTSASSAAVFFVVDANGIIRITKVDCDDSKLAGHIRKSLEGQQIGTTGTGDQVFCTRIIFKLL